MADPSAEDLAAVFGGAGKGPPPPMGDEPGPPPTEQAPDEDQTAALDGAIDEMFTTKDPVARREAFKRAMMLCEKSEGGY